MSIVGDSSGMTTSIGLSATKLEESSAVSREVEDFLNQSNFKDLAANMISRLQLENSSEDHRRMMLKTVRHKLRRLAGSAQELGSEVSRKQMLESKLPSSKLSNSFAGHTPCRWICGSRISA